MLSIIVRTAYTTLPYVGHTLRTFLARGEFGGRGAIVNYQASHARKRTRKFLGHPPASRQPMQIPCEWCR